MKLKNLIFRFKRIELLAKNTEGVDEFDEDNLAEIQRICNEVILDYKVEEGLNDQRRTKAED